MKIAFVNEVAELGGSGYQVLNQLITASLGMARSPGMA